jgi:hypothetical protein
MTHMELVEIAGRLGVPVQKYPQIEGALLGYTRAAALGEDDECIRAVYDFDKAVECLMSDRMWSRDEALRSLWDAESPAKCRESFYRCPLFLHTGK